MAEEFFGEDAEPGVLINSQECCAMLHASVVELYGLVQEGKLPMMVTDDGRRRFKLEDVYLYQFNFADDIYRRAKLQQFASQHGDLAEAE